MLRSTLKASANPLRWSSSRTAFRTSLSRGDPVIAFKSASDAVRHDQSSSTDSLSEALASSRRKPTSLAKRVSPRLAP